MFWVNPPEPAVEEGTLSFYELKLWLNGARRDDTDKKRMVKTCTLSGFNIKDNIQQATMMEGDMWLTAESYQRTQMHYRVKADKITAFIQFLMSHNIELRTK